MAFGKKKSKDKLPKKIRSTSVQLGTPANPSVAITEPEPYEQAVSSDRPKSTHIPKDYYGQKIDEPDVNNPTRWKFERPLDTVRAWHKLIDVDSHPMSQRSIRPESSHYRPTVQSFRPISFVGVGSSDLTHATSGSSGSNVDVSMEQ
ncbi:fungal protein [Schizosaccharomyces japonicus yFS275]|uniref:Fungal protein n=1 Tax=Schizosaccharomyces japonicus (strain yFS275 / FY16936) TaxID=402676 RepID=B6K066_SCHJY|nr:fungal protein [Schizosaccharomyces japonicus yFS275]EEB06216.1 fungal protein [Schizosaccharomyces japonicus yFS275]